MFLEFLFIKLQKHNTELLVFTSITEAIDLFVFSLVIIIAVSFMLSLYKIHDLTLRFLQRRVL